MHISGKTPTPKARKFGQMTILDKKGKRVAHLHVFGEVANFQTPEASGMGVVSMTTIKHEVEAAGGPSKFDEIFVHINSPGGEVSEGFAIYNYLVGLGKPITTQADGMVASIATVIFLSGTTRKVYKTTDFMIHNPWTMVVGDADQIEKNVEQLRRVEANLIDFYVQHTKAERQHLEQLMAAESYLSAEQLVQLGFATEVVEPVKAFAKVNTTQNHINMNKLKNVGKHFAAAWAELTRLGVPMAATVMTADGQELEIEMGDATEVQVGQSVMIAGEPAPDGEYMLENGSKIMVAAGIITEVMPAEPATTQEEAPVTVEIEALTAEIENLKAQLADKDTEVAEIVAHLKNIKTNYTPAKRAAAPLASAEPVKQAQSALTKEDVKAAIAKFNKK